MTDNPFDDLGGIDDESEQEPSETATASSSASAEPSSEPTESSSEPTTEAAESTTASQSSDSTRDESTDDVSGPAFEYSEVRQRPLYARGEMWDEFEDAVGISVIPELRKEGIRDEEKREIHDAVLTLAVEDPERVVEIILERRQS